MSKPRYVAQSRDGFRYLAVSKHKHTLSMEAIFVLSDQEDRALFVDRLAHFFAGKAIRVKIEEVDNKGISQRELLSRMEALRLRTEQIPITIPSGMDINDLIDDVNDSSL